MHAATFDPASLTDLLERAVDISVPVTESSIVWPGDPPVSLYRRRRLDLGDMANVTDLRMCVHTGSHVDAPNHFLPDAPGAEAVRFSQLVGRATVVDLSEPARKAVDAETLDAIDLPADVRRVLLRTRNSQSWRGSTFPHDYVGLTPDGARWLADRRVELVGIDWLGIAAFETPAASHEPLLGAGIAVLEGLDLSGVAAGEYLLLCLPILLPGSDGAPCRAVLAPLDSDGRNIR